MRGAFTMLTGDMESALKLNLVLFGSLGCLAEMSDDLEGSMDRSLRRLLRNMGSTYGSVQPVSMVVMALLVASVVAGARLSTGLCAAASGNPASVTVKENPKDGLKYVWIPAGTFMMGCSPGDRECKEDEEPSHRVTISAGFWMGQIEVTVKAYRKYTGETGTRVELEDPLANLPTGTFHISWYAASDYCGWAGGRLPTEAEWEYAARGGSSESRYGDLEEIAWYVRNSNRMAHQGALKKPNAFGLYDMLGNVWEWVDDWYDPDYYRHSPEIDPQGPRNYALRPLVKIWSQDRRSGLFSLLTATEIWVAWTVH